MSEELKTIDGLWVHGSQKSASVQGEENALYFPPKGKTVGLQLPHQETPTLAFQLLSEAFACSCRSAFSCSHCLMRSCNVCSASLQPDV